MVDVRQITRLLLGSLVGTTIISSAGEARAASPVEQTMEPGGLEWSLPAECGPSFRPLTDPERSAFAQCRGARVEVRAAEGGYQGILHWQTSQGHFADETMGSSSSCEEAIDVAIAVAFVWCDQPVRDEVVVPSPPPPTKRSPSRPTTDGGRDDRGPRVVGSGLRQWWARWRADRSPKTLTAAGYGVVTTPLGDGGSASGRGAGLVVGVEARYWRLQVHGSHEQLFQLGWPREVRPPSFTHGTAQACLRVHGSSPAWQGRHLAMLFCGGGGLGVIQTPGIFSGGVSPGHPRTPWSGFAGEVAFIFQLRGAAAIRMSIGPTFTAVGADVEIEVGDRTLSMFSARQIAGRASLGIRFGHSMRGRP